MSGAHFCRSPKEYKEIYMILYIWILGFILLFVHWTSTDGQISSMAEKLLRLVFPPFKSILFTWRFLVVGSWASLFVQTCSPSIILTITDWMQPSSYLGGRTVHWSCGMYLMQSMSRQTKSYPASTVDWRRRHMTKTSTLQWYHPTTAS